MLGRGQYYLEYPEDIRLYGASFSTTLPTGTAWSGEISYRPNAPVQVNTNDLTLAMVNPIAGGAASPIATTPGADNKGYRRKEVTPDPEHPHAVLRSGAGRSAPDPGR